jgi:AcrR family transcriptional regulator
MGRHREFDPDKALDAAVSVFWRKGFEGTSFTDLTEATGVARPGLYAAFGNKEEFFLKALDRYDASYMKFMREALAEPCARKVVERILRGCAVSQTIDPEYAGCLGINGAIACSDEAEPIRRELAKRRGEFEAALAKRLTIARDTGDLPSTPSPPALAKLVASLTQGMAIQAKGGATRGQLHEMVDAIMLLWPSP